MNCQMTIAGTHDEVLELAVLHAVTTHGHEDGPELRAGIEEGMDAGRCRNGMTFPGNRMTWWIFLHGMPDGENHGTAWLAQSRFPWTRECVGTQEPCARRIRSRRESYATMQVSGRCRGETAFRRNRVSGTPGTGFPAKSIRL